MRGLVFLTLLAACGGRETPPPPTPVVVEPAPPPPPPEPVYPQPLGSVTLVAVGDLLMHTNVKRSAAAADRRNEAGESENFAGYRDLFEHVDHVIAGADLAFANLETPVAPVSHRGTRSMVFNVDPVLLPALLDTGFDVVSFANNHVYDQGRAGLVETLDELDKAGLPQVGAGRTCEEAAAARLIEVKDVTIGLIGSTLVYNSDLTAGPDEACTFTLDAPTAISSAAAAREAGADLVVLSVHWGNEYHTLPRAEHVALAHELVEGGIDVVWGHHPHVVQPVETVQTADGRTAVIAYSLGNFISNQRYDYHYPEIAADRGNPRDGLLLRLTVEQTDLGPGPEGGEHRIETTLGLVEPLAVWTDNSSRRIVEDAPTIRPVMLDEALSAARQAEEPDEQRIGLLELRRAQVDAVLAGELPAPR